MCVFVCVIFIDLYVVVFRRGFIFYLFLRIEILVYWNICIYYMINECWMKKNRVSEWMNKYMRKEFYERCYSVIWENVFVLKEI